MSFQGAILRAVPQPAAMHSPTIDAVVSSLPYRDRQRVASELANVVTATNSLSVTPSPLVNRAGFTETLIALIGTVPIYYKHIQYNIPVSIYIPMEYPLVQPIVYVTPTKDMKIKQRHKHVDQNGMVYLPYLHTWNPQQSNLIELVTYMCSVFSEDPPVFKQTNAAATPPPVQPNMQQNAASVAYSSPISHSSPQIIHQQPPQQLPPQYSLSSSPIPPASTPPIPYQNNHLPQSNSFPLPSQNVSPLPSLSLSTPIPMDVVDPRASRKDHLVESVTAKVKAAIMELNEKNAIEMETLTNEQNTINNDLKILNYHLDLLKIEHHKLTESIKEYDEYNESIRLWNDTNDNITINEDNIDNIVVTDDTWSKQILECVSEDMALEDTMYVLDRALADDRIDIMNFTKQIRSLSRKQFSARALAVRIRQKQEEMARQQQAVSASPSSGMRSPSQQSLPQSHSLSYNNNVHAPPQYNVGLGAAGFR